MINGNNNNEDDNKIVILIYGSTFLINLRDCESLRAT